MCTCSSGGSGKEETVFKAKGDPLGWDMKTLKNMTNLQDTDLLYASFVSEVRLAHICSVQVHVHTCTYVYVVQV